MLRTPRLAYERVFLSSGLFQQGPASALFRTDTFRELGGFPNVPYAGDYLFWLRACAAVNVLLVSGELFHYRVHAGQEVAKPASVAAYARAAADAWRMLNSPECPLTGDALEVGKRNFVFSQTRGIFRYARTGRLRAAVTAARHIGLGVGDLLAYLRPPRRIDTAGTPRIDTEPIA
jgi:hypothetical protein